MAGTPASFAPPANRNSAASTSLSAQNPIVLRRAALSWPVSAAIGPLILRLSREHGLLQGPIFLARRAATLLDLDQFEIGQVELALGDIALAEIFARVDVLGIDRERLLVKRNAEIDVAELAVTVAQIGQHPGIVFVGDRLQHGDSLLVLPVTRQLPPRSRAVLIGQRVRTLRNAFPRLPDLPARTFLRGPVIVTAAKEGLARHAPRERQHQDRKRQYGSPPPPVLPGFREHHHVTPLLRSADLELWSCWTRPWSLNT